MQHEKSLAQARSSSPMQILTALASAHMTERAYIEYLEHLALRCFANALTSVEAIHLGVDRSTCALDAYGRDAALLVDQFQEIQRLSNIALCGRETDDAIPE